MVFNIRFIPDDWDRLAEDLERASDRLGPEIREGIREAAQEVADSIDEAAPSVLKGRTEVRIDESNRIPEWALITVDHPMGHIFEHGTGIYGPENKPITVKGGSGRIRRALAGGRGGNANRPPAMRFRQAGELVFRHTVRGMRAMPFFRPGLERSEPGMRERLSNMLRRIERRWQGR